MSAAEGAVENDDGDGVVDLGVLDAKAGGRDNSKVEEYPSSRGEIWECLEYINYTGSCCASDKADGTTLTPRITHHTWPTSNWGRRFTSSTE